MGVLMSTHAYHSAFVNDSLQMEKEFKDLLPLFLATPHHSLQSSQPSNIPDNLKVHQEKASPLHSLFEQYAHKFY